MRPTRAICLDASGVSSPVSRAHENPWEADRSVCPGKVWQGEERVEERGWAYRRRWPEGTVLYEAVKDNLATLLEEASEVERGLPRYVERDERPVPGVRSAGARLRAGALR
jgi:hypothetical protein